MPSRTTKMSLADRLGKAGERAFNKVKDKETRYQGGGDLPEGIEGGIAQLVDCHIGEYQQGNNKGEPFFYAAGVVIEPKEHNGQKIDGLRTSIGPIPLCDTPEARGKKKTLEDHLDDVSNELRKLGVETSEMDFTDLDATIDALNEEKPFFRFRTWKGKPSKQFPNPRVNHDWRGYCEYNGEVPEDDVTDLSDSGENDDDETETDTDDLTSLAEAADAGDEEAAEELEKRAKKLGIDSEEADSWASVADAIKEQGEGDEEQEYETSLQDLGEMADEGDDASIEQLESKAEEAELDPDDYETWSALAGALVSSQEEEESDGEEEEIEAPDKGDVVYYKPPRKREPLECEVTAVFDGKETCNLKSLDDGKTYKGIPWDKLEEPE